MSDIAHIDFEVYSDLNIKKAGGYRFCRHPSAEVLICAYSLPGFTRPKVWLPRTQTAPSDLVEYVARGGYLGAHNAAFERNVWRYTLSRQHPDLPEVKDSQWVCTAAMAAASGLPRALDKALAALELPVRKDPEGTRLIKLFCQPRKPTKANASTRVKPGDRAEDFKKFVEYCRTDVVGEMALHAALPELIARQAMFFRRLDMVMNDRGLPIDLPLVEKAFGVVRALEEHIGAQVTELTGGVKATQVAKMLEFFEERGVNLENMRAETVRQALKNMPDLDPRARKLLELRVEAGKASTKKLAAMLQYTDPTDLVVQGGFLFYGAHTGRYAGRGVQPHNFIRGMLKDRQRELVFQLLDMADPELFLLLYEKPIDVISQCMRGFIRAPLGYELAVVDYTAIEARVLAWVAGEEAMLEAYRQGVDVYKLMATKLYSIKIEEVSDEQRRISKNLVLGCGYQLGGVKFVDYCANAGLIIDPDFAMAAVKAYRKGVPAICESWKTVEQLVVQAIKTGEVVKGLKCKFYMYEHWLCIELPSGRAIKYPYARAVPCERWGKPAYEISFRTEIKGRFVREKTYGGKLIENIVQGIAFDLMMEGMYSAERAGYPVIGTVHDEILTLRQRGTSDVRALEKIVCDVPSWSKGIPLAAKGFVCERYKKD